MQLIGSIDPAVNARRAAHLLNVLEDETFKALGEYATKLDDVINNANTKFLPELLTIPDAERLTTNPKVQVIQKQINEEVEKNALLVGLTPKAADTCEIAIESDDRAKFLNAALDKLSTSFGSRKNYSLICAAVDEALKE